MSLAQIGEFAFVLLSRASNLHLVGVSACFLSSVPSLETDFLLLMTSTCEIYDY